MTSKSPLQHVLTSLALAASVGVVLLATIGYATVGYRAETRELEILSRQSAGRVARHIYANGQLWEFQVLRMADLIELNREDREGHRQSIVNAEGRVILKEQESVPAPSISRQAPIMVAGKQAGTLVIEGSLYELVLETGVVAVLSLGLAALIHAAFHRFPLRTINTTLDQLRAEQERVEHTLDELRQSQAQLMTQEAELLDVQRVTKLGGWSMEPDGSNLVISDQTLAVLGLRRADAPEVLLGMERNALEGGRASFETLIRAVLRSRTVQGQDFRFRRGDGRMMDIHVRMWPTEMAGERVLRLGGTVQDVSESKDAERQLEMLAYFDPLTSLANRALFKRELAAQVERCKRNSADAVLMLIDLDRFKEVNDSLGHAAGDELLKRVSLMLLRILPVESFVARLGGDEFAVILSGDTAPESVEAVATRIVDAVEKPVALGRSEAKIGASIGIVQILKDAADAETLVKYADLALYRAKDAGRGRFMFFATEMDEVIQHKMRLARDLRRAAAEDFGLEVWFQPLMTLDDRRIRGFEALMRWKHPALGYIPPLEFIPIAESSSLISDIGGWILRESARTLKAWIDAGGEAYTVSVNVSPAQIWQGDLEGQIVSILQETGLPAHLLCLELTESLFVDHSADRVVQVLKALKALGVSLALDDFGTGYSSLSMLSQLPFDKLKVDRAFVRAGPLSAKGQHVLQGIIALGHGLGMEVVAEGIEREEELAILEAAGCDSMQGYLLARPQPAASALVEGAGLAGKLRALLEESGHPTPAGGQAAA